MSTTNFWVVSGIFPSGFEAQGRLSYDASMANAFLDADIATPKEDSLLLLYRSSPAEPWQLHPDFKVLPFLPTDGKGDVVINGLAPGEYALARGAFMTSAIHTPALHDQVKSFSKPDFGSALGILARGSISGIPVSIGECNGNCYSTERLESFSSFRYI